MDIKLILKALANEKRLAILEWLKEPAKYFPLQDCGADADEVCVGLIEQKLGVSQSTTSKYLSQLHNAGLITSARKGQWTFYKYNATLIQDFLTVLTHKI